jgi:signal transduction histidine kinase
MYIVNNLSIFPLISAIICTIVMVYITIKGEKSGKLYSLLFLLSCVILWSLGQFLEYSTVDVSLILQYTKILHTGSIYLGVACFIFCLYYVNSELIKKYSKVFPIVFIIPTIIVLSVYTNELHWLFIKIESLDIIQKTYTRKLGLFYWMENVNNYFFTSLSILIVIKSIFKSSGELRKQRFILALVLIVPTCSALLFDIFIAVNNGITTSFDIAPTSFSLSLALLVIATFKYSFWDIVPITLKNIYYNMKDSVIIIDRRNRILKYNNSFAANFSSPDNFIQADDLIQYIAKYQINELQNFDLYNAIYGKVSLPVNGDIHLRDEKTDNTRIFDVSVNSVNNSTGFVVGRIITFCDITAYKVLAAENERNRITLEIHDSIGYGLTNLIMLLKDCKISYIQNPKTINNKIDNTLNIAEKMLRDLRFTVAEFKSDKDYDVVNAIDSLADYIRSMGVAVEIKVIGEDQYQRFKNNKQSLYISDVLYRVSREAVTNSLRHGKASEIKIIIKFCNENINLYIIDNGQGCKEIKKGIGLLGMEERVKGIGGRISYGSNDDKGFNISIQIPLAVQVENDKSISC